MTFAQETHVFEEWVSTSGTQDFYIHGKSVTDAAGSVYQVGATLNDIGGYDAIISKHDRSGQELWTEIFNPSTTGDDIFIDVILTSTGDVVATGVSRNSSETASDVFTVQLNAGTGNTDWQDSYSYSGSIYNVGSALATDGSDNVYVTGITSNFTTLSDVLVVKYNSTGSLQWAVSEDVNGMEDGAVKLAYNSGKLTASGATQVLADKYRYLVIEFDASDGSLLNSFEGSDEVTSVDQVQDLVVDDAGNIYITGYAGATGEGYNMYTVKLNDELNILWEDSYNHSGSNHDRAYGIALDNSGNVIVTGSSDVGVGNTQFTTLKYNSTGTLQWVKANEISAGADTARAVITDANDNIYITGSFSNGSNQDVKTIKYSPAGTQLWAIDYNGQANGDEYVLDITLDGDDVLVCAQTWTGSTYKYAAIRYTEKEVIVPNDEEQVPSSMYFTKNHGVVLNTQGNIASDIKFFDRSQYPAVFVQDDRLSFVLSHVHEEENDTVQRVDLVLNKNNTEQRFYPLNKTNFHTNYYRPDIQEDRRERQTSYNTLIGFNTYEDVDVMLSHNDKGLKHYLICKPGFDVNDISWEYAGANQISVGSAGELIISTDVGALSFAQGEAYEMTPSGTRIDMSWQPTYSVSGNTVSLGIGSYNASNTLILELDRGEASSAGGSQNGNLLWSTYWGGSGFTSFMDIETDNDGNQYIGGGVGTPTFPVTTGTEVIQDYIGGYDALVVKVNSDQEPVWMTHFGGATSTSNPDVAGGEYARAIDVTADGQDIYIVGSTRSSDMIIEDGDGAYYSDDENECASSLCNEGFIARFKEDGELVWSTYYGASDNDEEENLNDIAIDNAGNIYAVGQRSPNADLLTRAGADNFSSGTGSILMFDADNQLVWANAYDVLRFNAVATDADNNVHICGVSVSFNSPVTNPDPDYTFTSDLGGDADGYVVSFADDGETNYAFYYGGPCADICSDIGANDNGDVYVTGFSFGLGGEVCDQVNNPLVVDGGFAPTDEQPESFVFKIDNYTGGDANISRGGYFGGGGEEVDQLVGAYQFSISVLPSGSFVLSGSTNSQDGNPFFSPSIQAPSTQPPNYYVEPFAAGSNFLLKDAFLAYFNEDFNLIWSTYFGGSKEEIPSATAVTNDETRLYFVGVQCTNNSLSPDIEFTTEEYNTVSNSDYYQQFPDDPLNSGTFPSYCALFDISGIPLSSSPHDEESASQSIQLFPNPTKDWLTISGIDQELVDIRITNSIGTIVKRLVDVQTSEPINVSDLASGYYILNVSNDYLDYSKPFIKL